MKWSFFFFASFFISKAEGQRFFSTWAFVNLGEKTKKFQIRKSDPANTKAIPSWDRFFFPSLFCVGRGSLLKAAGQFEAFFDTAAFGTLWLWGNWRPLMILTFLVVRTTSAAWRVEGIGWVTPATAAAVARPTSTWTRSLPKGRIFGILESQKDY